MNFNIRNLDIKVRGNDKKHIFKIFMILVLINVLVTIVVLLFANVEILKTILLYIMSIVYVGIVVYIIKKENKVIGKSKESFENKYDPILTKFIIKNEFILDNELLNAEIYYLIKKGYVEIDKENNVLRLKDRNQFKQIDALERIDSEKIKEYSTNEVPSYESMFIGKILFAFHDEIELNEFKRNQKGNYYLERGEMCKLAMEKMLLYEIEKKNMLGKKSSNINFVSIAGILNIITSIMLFMVIGRFNIILLLATIINIALIAVIIKNENILAYKYSEDVIKYIDNLLEYVNILKKGKTTKFNNPTYEEENINISGLANEQDRLVYDLHNAESIENNLNNKIDENNHEDEETTNERDTDEELKFLFGINTSEDLFI